MLTTTTVGPKLTSATNIINTLRPRQNGRHFADDIFKYIFLNENVWIPIKISLKFVPKGRMNNIPALVQMMAWRRPGDKPLSEPMMVSLPTHTCICVTRPPWVNAISQQLNIHRLASLNWMTLQMSERHLRHLQRSLFMEQYNLLSWTWNAKGGPWKIMTSSKGGDDEQPQVFAICCVHACTSTRMVPNSVTRNNSYTKGRSRSHEIVVLSKVSLEHSRWPQTQSPVQVSTKRTLIDEVDFFVFTNYESIYTQCDGSRLLEYFSINVLQIGLA